MDRHISDTGGTSLYNGVTQSLAAWNTFLQQSGGNISILTGSGMPLVLAQPTYYVSVGPVQSGKDATTRYANDATGTVFSATTFFSADYQAQNNNGTLIGRLYAAGLHVLYQRGRRQHPSAAIQL